ncbi:MAG: hypothetical protein ACRD0N_14740 [Acidimicrobiales bacterium]
MTLRIVLSVAEVALFVLVLAFFLTRIRQLLDRIIANLERIADGVDAVQGHCALVGPGVVQVNTLLNEAAGNLNRAARAAELLAP